MEIDMENGKITLQERVENNKALSLTVKIVTLLASLGALVLAVLQLFKVWDGAISYALILLSLEMLLQAFTLWHRSRGIAITNLVAAAITLGCSVAVIIIRAVSG